MSAKEGLSRIGKALRALGLLWFIGWTVAAVYNVLDGTSKLMTREEQVAAYERAVGHSIEDDIRKLPPSAKEPDAFEKYFALNDQQEQILSKHFGGAVRTKHVMNWAAGALLLAIGLVGYGVAWGLGWIVAGFAK